MSSRALEPGRSRAVPLLVLALLVLAALTGPARAAEGEGESPGPDFDMTPDEAFDAMNEVMSTGDIWPLDPGLHFDVLDDLLLEIALLAQLDAFTTPTPSFVSDIHAAYGPWPAAPAELTMDFLIDVDDNQADRKSHINDILGPAPALAYALDEIPEDTRRLIADGTPGVVDPIPYAKALSEVLSFGNADELAAIGAPNAAIVDALPFELQNPEIGSELSDLRAMTAAPALGSNTAPNPTLPTDTRPQAAPTVDSDQGSSLPWWILVVVAAALAALAAAIVSIRRSRTAANPSRGVDDGSVTATVFEAHRRLAAAVDEDQIAEIGGEAAASITDAADAFIFRHTPDGLRRIGASTVIVSTALSRVIDTAQPLVTVLDNDPAVSSAAVCAVPLVHEGTVCAVLVVRRPSERPFGNEDRRRLELLAPALGAALASADTLDSYEHMALVDGLTSLGNRRRLDGDLETTLSEARKGDLPVAFAMIDVDHFKNFNDTHGHEAGDRALQTVARVIADTVRTTDVVYRYGGEEFSVLLPGATFEEATRAAERMRAAVEAARVEGEETQPGGRLTISVGVSTLESGDAGELKSRADRALYEAKAQGRNRFVVA